MNPGLLNVSKFLMGHTPKTCFASDSSGFSTPLGNLCV